MKRFSSLTLDSISLTLDGVTNIDGAHLSVSGGAVLTLPGVRSFRNSIECCGAQWIATGAGSVLNLPGLTNLSGSALSWYMNLQALAGGQVVLSNVVTIPDSYLSVLADGPNSVVDLSGLTDYLGINSTLALEARNGGTILVPQLVYTDRVNITLRLGGCTGSA